MLNLLLILLAAAGIFYVIWLIIADRIDSQRQQEEDRAKAEQDRRDSEYDAQRAAFRAKRSTAPTAKAAAAQSMGQKEKLP